MNPLSAGFPDNRVPIAFDQQKMKLTWAFSAGHHFTKPFFQDSISALKRQNAPMRLTSTDELLYLYSTISKEQRKPGLFIFHVSRCGSTLISQMLAQSDKSVVYSEPPILDQILSSDLSVNEKRDLLMAVVWSLNANSKDDRIVSIKWDSWHLYFVELIFQAFPTTPVIFLYRNPIEVLYSHQKRRGIQMVPGLLRKDVFSIKDVPAYDLDRYAVKVLEFLFQWMLGKSRSENVYLLNYNELPDGLFQLLSVLEIPYSKNDIDLMQSRARQDSKNPRMEYSPALPGQIKVREISALLEGSALSGTYQALERLRKERLIY